MNPTIKTAINIVGSQKKLGEACDVFSRRFTSGSTTRQRFRLNM
nr:MAG TPA: hypothetical protein [Bacteriophage sp.]